VWLGCSSTSNATKGSSPRPHVFVLARQPQQQQSHSLPTARSASASSCRPIPSLHLLAEGQFNKTTFRRILVQPPLGPRHGKPAAAPFHVAPRAHGQVAACVCPFLSPNRRFRASLIPRSTPRDPEQLHKSCPRPPTLEAATTSFRLRPDDRSHGHDHIHVDHDGPFYRYRNGQSPACFAAPQEAHRAQGQWQWPRKWQHHPAH
jgi:hypothetical protein